MTKLPSPKCSDRIVNGEAFKAMQEELNYLRYFYEAADFGPAHEDVVVSINNNYGQPIPQEYQL